MLDSSCPVGRTPEAVWAERLVNFKSQEKPESVLLLAEDPELVRITVAWTNTTTFQPQKFTRQPQSNNPHEWWEWLWQNRVYSRQEIMDKAANADFRFDRKLRTLIGNHIIYPDGTVNSFVQRYLREKVLKLFQSKSAQIGRKKEW